MVHNFIIKNKTQQDNEDEKDMMSAVHEHKNVYDINEEDMNGNEDNMQQPAAAIDNRNSNNHNDNNCNNNYNIKKRRIKQSDQHSTKLKLSPAQIRRNTFVTLINKAHL